MFGLRKVWVFFWVLGFPIFGESSQTFHLVDTSDYPKIRITFASPRVLDLNDLLISETTAGVSRIQTQIRLAPYQDVPTKHLIVSLPNPNSGKEKTWVLQLLRKMAQLSEVKKVTFSFHLQTEGNGFRFFEDPNIDLLDVGFPWPKEKSSPYPLKSWLELTQHLEGKKQERAVILFVRFDSVWSDRFQISEFSKVMRKNGHKAFILAPSSLEAQKLAEYTEGSFFPISNPKSYSALASGLSLALSPDLCIEYMSLWPTEIWESREVLIDLHAKEQQLHWSRGYTVSPWYRIWKNISDPFVFLPFVFFLVLLCISALYYLRGFPAADPGFKNVEATSDLSLLSRESEVYEKVYGDTIEKAQKDKEIAQQVKSPVFFGGKSYSYAVLISKQNQIPQTALDWEETWIGRSSENQIQILDPSVALRHAKIKKRKDQYILFDCLAEPGVFLNGKKLLRPKSLQDMDEIRLGNVILSFRGRT